MDIVVIGSPHVRNEDRKRRLIRIPGKSRPIVDRRRNKVDRRQSVRDGVTVTLSSRTERRRRSDRRRTASV